MASKRKTHTVSNVTEYLEVIFELESIDSGVRCYRGEGNNAWKLQPSIMRGLKPNAENQIFSELIVEAPSEFSNDNSMFEKLVRAQHYGLPTRLLDVSLNPLVGLYFACYDEQHSNTDGSVRVFDFIEQAVKFPDSDTISLIGNLARLSDSERKEITNARKKYNKNTKSEKALFRAYPALKRLMQFVRIEKPYFLDLIEPSDLFRYFFVYPANNNRRIIAQSGAFIAAGLLQYRSVELAKSFKIQKIIIPAGKKQSIITQLDTINVNSRTVFPEVEFASSYIKKKWSISD